MDSFQSSEVVVKCPYVDLYIKAPKSRWGKTGFPHPKQPVICRFLVPDRQ